MWQLALALVLFAATHAAPAHPGIRSRLVRLMGQPLYLVVYSAASLGLLLWVVAVYRAAPFIEVWETPAWWRRAALIVVGPAVLLLVLGLRPPQPGQLGVYAITRHPAMWALALWAAVHVVGNGDVASILMFSLFGLLALPGAANAGRRWRNAMGEDGWQRFEAATNVVPFVALARGSAKLSPAHIPPRGLVLAVSIYAALVLLHGPVIGIPLIE